MRDSVEGGPSSVAVRLTLPLAPGLRAWLVGGDDAPAALRVALGSGAELCVALPGEGAVRWRLEPSDYFPEFGLRLGRWCLVGESETFRSGTWRFALAR